MSNTNIKTTAIVLSAGKGKRMMTDVPKQYLPLNGRPVIYYALKAFEDSLVDDIVLVAGEEDKDFLYKEVIEKYSFNKVRKIVSGGAERYNSVYNGLCASAEDTSYVFIHDGARPLITPGMIEKLYNEVQEKKAVIAACPAKDTIKVIGEDCVVTDTPDRKKLWQVQTPQVFDFLLIKEAYLKLADAGDNSVTDDAMVAEKYTDAKVYLCDTGSSNIKITTRDDLVVASALLQNTQNPAQKTIKKQPKKMQKSYHKMLDTNRPL